MRVITALVCTFLICSAQVAQGQYKCVTGGKTVYSDLPCAGRAVSVASPQDAVTPEQQRQRERVNARELQMVEGIEQEKAELAYRRRQTVAAIEQTKRNEASRCRETQAQRLEAERREARYRDFGWRNSASQARIEQETLDEAVRQYCR